MDNMKRTEETTPGGLAYERFERRMKVSALECQAEVREACGQCLNCGRNLACPPGSPHLEEYIKGSREALVIAVRVQTGELEALGVADGFEAVRAVLVEELLQWRERGHTVGGSGPCRACPECAGFSSEGQAARCRQPDKRIFSLESMGVNVVDLMQDAFGIELDWASEGNSPGQLCAVGAVFF